MTTVSFQNEGTEPDMATVPELRGPWTYSRTLASLDLDT